MPKDFINDFIDKMCIIMFINDGVQGRIVAVEDNWIKVEEKSCKIRIVNVDMIRDIMVLPEKNQK